MTLTPRNTVAAAMKIPVLPGIPTGIDSTDVVVQMVRRAASPGFESWWRKAENVGFCANPIHLSAPTTVMVACCGSAPKPTHNPSSRPGTPGPQR
jgi:hypothetical protein